MRTLDHCPLQIECCAKLVYVEDDDSVWSIVKGKLVEHRCNTRTSDIPKFAIMGEWFNKRTGRTRYTGPYRSRRTAMAPPPSKREGPVEDWEFKQLHVAKLEWTVVEA